MRQILFSDYYNDFYDEEVEDTREKKMRYKAFFLTLGILGLFLLPGLLYLSQKIQYVRSNYRINALAETKKSLENENRMLRTSRDQLAAPERIEAIARSSLGMIPTDRPPIFMDE